MTTIINSPASAADSGGNSFLIGAIILCVFVLVLIFFGIPELRKIKSIELNVPIQKIVIPNMKDADLR